MMLSRSRRAACAAAMALGGVFFFSAMAEAGNAAPGMSGSEFVIPEGSVLATPDEVAVMGGTAAEVAAQQAVWDALPARIAREQRQLNAAEHRRYAAAFENIVEPTAAPSTPGMITPMIYQEYCAGANFNSYYKITSDDQAMQCFAGSAGTYYLNPTFADSGSTTIRVQAGAHKGRTYYRVWTTLFWSTTHGPNDYTWYKFTIDYDWDFEVLRVQFL